MGLPAKEGWKKDKLVGLFSALNWLGCFSCSKMTNASPSFSPNGQALGQWRRAKKAGEQRKSERAKNGKKRGGENLYASLRIPQSTTHYPAHAQKNRLQAPLTPPSPSSTRFSSNFPRWVFLLSWSLETNNITSKPVESFLSQLDLPYQHKI